MDKMEKDIIYNHFGFPIELKNCLHTKIDGNWRPRVNYKQLAQLLFDLLPIKPAKLNGAEIKFIRNHLEMTQKEFAAWLNDPVEETTISKWEKFKLQTTNMPSPMERSLRLQLINLRLKNEHRNTMRFNDYTDYLNQALANKQNIYITIQSKEQINKKEIFKNIDKGFIQKTLIQCGFNKDNFNQNHA